MSIVIRPGQFHAEPHPAGKLATTLLSVTVAGMADPPRFRRGKAYVADHAVSRLEVSPGTLRASVTGSRREPYEVIVTTALTPRPHFGNAESMRTVLAQLVPDARDLMVSCTCPDWDDPCKHAVAAILAFAEELTARPELLMEWRCHAADDDGTGGRAAVGSRAATGRHLRLAPPLAGGSGEGRRLTAKAPVGPPAPPPNPFATPAWREFLGSGSPPDAPTVPTDPAPTGHGVLGTIDLGEMVASALDVFLSLD